MTRGALDYFCCDGVFDGFVCEKGYDDTWECTDRKDHLGNVIEEQGAVLGVVVVEGEVLSPEEVSFAYAF